MICYVYVYKNAPEAITPDLCVCVHFVLLAAFLLSFPEVFQIASKVAVFSVLRCGNRGAVQERNLVWRFWCVNSAVLICTRLLMIVVWERGEGSLFCLLFVKREREREKECVYAERRRDIA